MLTKVKCKSCQGDVDSIAKACAHCGAAEPGKGKSSPVEMAVGLLVLFLMFWGALTLKDIAAEWWNKKESIENAEEARLVAERESACKADLQCWGDKNSVASELACGQAVEKLAKYSVRWTTGALHSKFGSFKWKDKGRSVLTYVGDKVEFQNGFGAYQAMVYTCDYDPVNKRVLGVWANPGRF